MSILNILIAVLFILYGLAGIVGLAYLYYSGLNHELFAGINIYKVPANIIGGLAAIIGGFKAIGRKNRAFFYIGISVFAYIVGATYEIILEHGLYFYKHIMGVFFWTAGVQLALLMALVLVTSHIEKTKKNNYGNSGDNS